MTKSRNKAQFFRPQQRVSPARIPHIMACVFTGRERQGWVAPGLTLELMRMAFGSGQHYRLTYSPIDGFHPISAARNHCVENIFLKSDADILLMIDNDITPPPDLMEAILNMPPECDIACFVYWVWGPQLAPMLCVGQWEMTAQGKQMVATDFASSAWHEIGAGGTGCIAIRRRVLEEMPKPIFKIDYDNYIGQAMSEDIFFTSRAKEAGYRLFTHPGYICSHSRTMDLAEINSGMVARIRGYIETVRRQYGDIGVRVPTLNEILGIQIRHNIWVQDDQGIWSCPDCSQVWPREAEPACKCNERT